MNTSGFRLVKASALASTSTVALLAGALMTAPPASAQAQTAQEPSLDEIVVTGSRIVRDGYEAPTPVSVLSADELNAMNDAQIADSVNKLPAFSGSQTQRTGAVNLSSGAAGVNILNLRGLGGHRVLILLDGKRVINSSLSSGYTGGDTNTMPQGLISRVDVSTGGASAAYGSDALSGVVNFVLDKEFTGIKGEVQTGVSTYGDDPNAQANATFGTAFAGGKGHFLLFGEYYWNKGLVGNFRPWNEEGGVVLQNSNRTATNGQPWWIVGKRVGVNNAMPGGLITRGPLKGLYFGPGGVPANFNYGMVSNSNLMQDGDWKISRIDWGVDLDPKATRQNYFTRLSYDLADYVQVWGEAHWSYARAENTNNVNRLFDQVVILSGNPYIPAEVQTRMTALGLTNITLGSSSGDVGRFYADNSRNVRRWSVGADGSFSAGDSDWTWDIYYQYTQQGLSSRVRNSGHVPRINQATDAVRHPTTGGIVCRSTLTAPNNGCVPFNFFGVGVNSQAAIDWFKGDAYRYDTMRQKIIAATLNGEPFDTWAGPVSIATGLEHRTEQVNGRNTPDDEIGNYLAGNFKLNIGKLTVKEAFLETVIPLANDTAFARALDLSAAVRATDYSSSGYVTTWKAGATWQVVDDLRFRVTRSRDIRAANLGELYAGGTAAGAATFTDPFTGTQVPQAFSLSSGNPTLAPERADTTGIGVVLTPQFLQGFGASVDYYNIDIKGAVATPNGQSIIDGCFAGITNLCPNILRDANGRIHTVITSPQNVAYEIVRGIDFEVSYRMPVADLIDSWDGDLAFRVLANKNLKTESFNPTLSANQLVDGKGVIGGFAVAGYSGRSNPKYKVNTSVRYSTEAISATLAVRYSPGGVYNNAFIECTTGCPANNNRTIDNNQIDSDTLVDLGLSYKPFDEVDTEVFLSVTNLLNSAPPFIAGGNGSGYYSGQSVRDYDTIGRFFTVGVRFQM